MSQEHGRNDETFDADTSIVGTGFLNRFVKMTGAHTVGLCGLGQRAIGVLKNQPEGIGRPAVVRKPGASVSSKIVAGGVIAAGAEITSDAVGRAITAGATNVVNGITEEAATAIGDVIETTLVNGRVV